MKKVFKKEYPEEPLVDIKKIRKQFKQLLLLN